MGLMDRLAKVTDRVTNRFSGTDSAHGSSTAQKQPHERQQHEYHGERLPITHQALMQARDLVASAVQDLTAANETITAAHGILGAAKTASSAIFGSASEDKPTWSDAGKAITHDGRLASKGLVNAAHDKYEQANEVIGGGLPEIESAVVKPNKINEKATEIAGAAGGTMANVAQAGAKLTAVVLGSGLAGPISLIVKKHRTKKATKGISEMLNAYQQVLSQMEAALASNNMSPMFQ